MQSICSPLFGSIGERWNLRWMMALGVFLGGGALFIGSSVGGLVQFYLMYALLNVGFAASTFVPQVQILSNWFVKRRGLAMGVANSGQGFAAVLDLAVPFLIAVIGWRGSYLVLAGFTTIIIFPLTAALLRDHPHERDTVADAPFLSATERDGLAEKERKARRSGTVPMAGVPFLEQVFSVRFFLIAFTYSAIAFIMTGTVVHIVPHATDQGCTPETSGLVFLLWGMLRHRGNLTSGVSDSLGARTDLCRRCRTGGIILCFARLFQTGDAACTVRRRGCAVRFGARFNAAHGISTPCGSFRRTGVRHIERLGDDDLRSFRCARGLRDGFALRYDRVLPQRVPVARRRPYGRRVRRSPSRKDATPG